MRLALTWCGLALLAVGCGGQAPPAASPAEREAEPAGAAPPATRAEATPESLEEPASDEASGDASEAPGLAAELSSADAAFGESLAEGRADCASAERFKDEICRLARRICELERSEPRSTAPSCEDGRRRCEQAQRRFDEVCG